MKIWLVLICVSFFIFMNGMEIPRSYNPDQEFAIDSLILETKLKIALKAYDEKSWDQVRPLLFDVINQGLRPDLRAQACYFLAKMYYFGYGQPVNYEEAFNLFTEARSQASTFSLLIHVQEYIADMYYLGLGTQQDVEQAKRIFEVLAYQSQSSDPKGFSLARLAEIYFKGRGVEKDLPKAYAFATESLQYLSKNNHAAHQAMRMLLSKIEAALDFAQ